MRMTFHDLQFIGLSRDELIEAPKRDDARGNAPAGTMPEARRLVMTLPGDASEYVITGDVEGGCALYRLEHQYDAETLGQKSNSVVRQMPSATDAKPISTAACTADGYVKASLQGINAANKQRWARWTPRAKAKPAR